MTSTLLLFILSPGPNTEWVSNKQLSFNQMKDMNGTLQKKTKRLPHRAFVLMTTYYRM